jgi:hypothetical protein
MTPLTTTPIAQLNQTQLSRLQQTEKQFPGCVLVAYDEPYAPAPLSAEQLRALQALEQDLGVMVVAYQNGHGQH